ncbi:MAG: hypothetical protein WC852_07000 [Candidatus Nanoarchaeia archaeon]
MNKKGIGPIIAFVLLMALSVTLGAFVTIWYTKSTEGQAKTVIEKYGNADECSDVKFDVAFDYNNTDEDGNACGAVVYNLGSFSIDKLKVEKVTAGLPESEIFEGEVIKPKTGVIVEVLNLKSVSKMQFAPIIVESGTATQCINDRVFIPDSTLADRCP